MSDVSANLQLAMELLDAAKPMVEMRHDRRIKKADKAKLAPATNFHLQAVDECAVWLRRYAVLSAALGRQAPSAPDVTAAVIDSPQPPLQITGDHMTKYTKLAADGSDLPADATDHLAVRVDHELLARPMIWTAHRSKDRMSWADAKKWAEALTINGWSWRLPTAEEAFLLCDRFRTQYPLVDPTYFPDCDGEWIWTGTEDKTEPAGVAWCCYLYYGFSYIGLQTFQFHVRAVRAGQF